MRTSKQNHWPGLGLAHLLLLGCASGCATLDEAPTSEPAPSPQVEIPVGPPGVQEARERTAAMFPNGVARSTAATFREMEAPARTVDMTWVDVPAGSSEIAFDGTPLQLAVENKAAGPVTVRLDVLFSAGQRARRWSSRPVELPAGSSDMIQLDLVREGVRLAEVARGGVDVRATLEIFAGDDRMDGAMTPGQRGTLREGSFLRLRRRAPGDDAQAALARARALREAAPTPARYRDVEIVAVEEIDESQSGVEDAIQE